VRLATIHWLGRKTERSDLHKRGKYKQVENFIAQDETPELALLFL
jgi:hypothetical protein